MNVNKAYQVQVKAYKTKLVPKHTKIFDTEEKALSYKTELENNVMWNTPVSIETVSVYLINDGNTNYLLQGNYISVE